MTHPKQILRELEQRARKRFGQHFLVGDGVVDRIVRGSRVKPGDDVVEIGPGLGALTHALVRAGVSLTAVELDRDLAGYIRGLPLDIDVVEGDALQLNWAEVLGERRVKVVANLPYNVGTGVLMRLLRDPAHFESVTVMLQREVVNRLVAESGSRTYGALSVEAQVRAQPIYVMTVPPGAFHPPPKVESAVVRFELFDEPQTGDVTPAFFDRVVRAAFSQRRKVIANSLGPLFGKDAARAALAAAGIDAGIRAERLDLDGFRALARELAPPDELR